MALSPTVKAVVAHEAGKTLSPEEQALVDAHLSSVRPQQQVQDTAAKSGEILQQQ